ncbi:MAG: phosphoglucosamine mutase [Gammaproteobacteria bacterium RIFOXYA12_FULL_61_12]|nr:MAG: phosphoglucosamine mutase [Gammaproteobacteria bacterium RIFOXYD12_FULL_61_37]OGT93544.1 MAG: phosphoglucosamine mutase [Gammaproteobacteria bacterium RIFOXYA12_FULL_61_12]
MKRKYFGTDGIRGRVGDDKINPEFILKLGWAAGRVLGQGVDGKILIGKDTRISGYMFESALEAGLAAAGVDIHLLGPMPTPGIAYLTRTFRAQAGIVISASHNPHHDNGIKFFSSDGSKLPDEVEMLIEEEMDKPMETVGSQFLGKAYRIDDAAGRYIEFCKSTVPSNISFQGMKILVDCANGAAYHIAPHVFEEMGAEVIAIGVTPDGLNINKDVGSTHMEKLRVAVLEQGADLGIALDGDADRVLMVDSAGEIIDGDQLLYIIACSRIRNREFQGAVVGTLMSNLGLEHALADKGIVLDRVQVGDRYIMERLKERSWILGGESSGHIICLDRTTTGDGIVSALQILVEMRQTGQDLGQLLGGLKMYPQKLINVRLKSRDGVLENPAVIQALADAEKELGNRGRVLLRPSGTEPLIRVMVEGIDLDQVEEIAARLAGKVKEAGSKA